MNRRSFMRMFGAAGVASVAVSPVHFLAPRGGWSPSTILRCAHLVSNMSKSRMIEVLVRGSFTLEGGRAVVIGPGDPPWALAPSTWYGMELEKGPCKTQLHSCSATLASYMRQHGQRYVTVGSVFA